MTRCSGGDGGVDGGDDDDDDGDDVPLDDDGDGVDFPSGREFPGGFLPAGELFLSGVLRPGGRNPSTVRAISSDRGKIVSGADDQSVIVWDNQTLSFWKNLRAMMLRMAHVWDIRSSKQMFKLQGHTKWIRSMRMTGETIITGSDDWTARVWSLTRGTCDVVLACHAGPILCVEYSPSDKAIITGGIRCVKNLTLHSASVLSISAGDHWLGIGAAGNSMSLFHQPQERFGSFSNTGSKAPGWQIEDGSAGPWDEDDLSLE
ncbi:hypothetical protein QYE76_012975, partial [Lolium multiflorum]